MKILAISDEVVPALYDPGIESRYGDVDLVLSCGDLPNYYLEFIVTMLNVPLYYVKGNHDVRAGAHFQVGWDGRRGITKASLEPGGCVNIDGRVVEHRGLLIAGLEGSMRYKLGPNQYTQTEMGLRALGLGMKLLPRMLLRRRYLDILITHAAPFGIHDGQDRCHTGFRAFLQFMERCRPQYLIHGHTHVYDQRLPTKTRYRDTMVVNTHPYRILEVGTREEASWN